MKRKIIAILDIFISIILFVILLFSDISDSFVYIITFSLFIGWLMPYLSIFISGISLLNNSNQRLTLLFNIFSLLLSGYLLFLTMSLYEKKLLIILIEYIVLLVINLLNIIYLIIYVIKNPDLEKSRKKLKNKEELNKIKEAKKNNNGAVL